MSEAQNGGNVMENILQNFASGLWIVIGIQVLVWLKRAVDRAGRVLFLRTKEVEQAVQ